MRPVARFVEPRTSEERPVLLGKPPRARRRPRPETLEFGDRTLRANDAVVNTWDNEIENMKQTQVPGYLQVRIILLTVRAWQKELNPSLVH